MEHNSFTPFSRSPIWDIQRNYFSRQGIDAWRKNQVPHYITSNPVMALSYSRIAMAYLLDFLEQTKEEFLEGKKPFYILELGAGCGRFSFYFIRQFFQALDASPFSLLPVCYVMTDFTETNIDEWASHPQFKPWIDQGRLDFARFDAEKDNSLSLINQKLELTPQSIDTPLMIIANYVFDGLLQDLFFINNKKLSLGGLIVRDKDGETIEHDSASREAYFEGLKFEYQLLEIEGDYYSLPLWNKLLNEYAEKVFSSIILFPGKTLSCLDNLRRLSSSGYLLLSADRGSHLPQDLVNEKPPAITRHGSFSLPVNFYLIGRFLEEQGAAVKQFDRRKKGLNFLIAFNGDKDRGNFWRTTGSIREYMEDFSPDDFFRLKRAADKHHLDLTLNQMLAYLQLSRWDYKFFILFKQELFKRLPEVDFEEKKVWRKGIERMLDSYLDIGEDGDLYFEAGNLFSNMDYWGQAKKCYEKSLVRRGPRTAIYFNLAVCWWNMGSGAKTELYLSKALQIEPDNEEAEAFLHKVRQWRRRAEAFPLKLPSIETACGKNDFSPGFEALGLKHVRIFLRLYKDTDIAVLTRLPKLSNLEETGEWVKEQTNKPDRLLSAIMHPEYGFVGALCLKLGSRDGLVWYWLGKEYRNQGLATSSLLCLRKTLDSASIIQNLYATVYENNSASRRTLEKAGFQRLKLSFKPPHKELLLYGLIRDDYNENTDHLSRINDLIGKNGITPSTISQSR